MMILENLAIRGLIPIPITRDGSKRIVIKENRIQGIQSTEQDHNSKNEDCIRFQSAVALPGLINSHDHLEFNLFPLLANRVYNNYTEWARDIQLFAKKQIEAVLKIPEDIRIEWGCYKNLLNGFTTVVNHGKRVEIGNSPIHVLQSCTSLHSTTFEKFWKLKLNYPFNRRRMVAMHIGEGRDEMAAAEIDTVTRWNRLHKKIIAIHGIAMSNKQAEDFEGLVWCPASNYKLIGETANIEELADILPVAFGTDSTLSAEWNAWTHFRLALGEPVMTEDFLLDILTSRPSALWRLTGKGMMAENALADLVIMEQKPNLFENNPENILMVIQNGKIRLFDESLISQVELPYFKRISIKNRVKFVEGDLPGLINKIRSYHPSIDLPVTA